jgi:hypothetical protein
MILRLLAAWMCATAALAAPAPAQTPAPQTPPAQKEPPKRLEAWPQFAGEELKTVKTDIERLRKAHTPEMGQLAEDALVAAGPGVVPLLVPVLAKEKDEEALQRVTALLAKITTAAHTRLLAAEFGNKEPEVRVWVMRRCAAFPDPGVRPAADAALERVKKLGEKADREELYAAGLCATSAGSLAGLDVLQTWALSSWGKRGVEMRVALESVRGPEASAKIGALIKDSDLPAPDSRPPLGPDRQRVVAALNLLAGCGDKSVAGKVRPFLDSTDNSIRIAAINAVRGIADGELPVADLPVFDAIELAKKLKSKL